MYFYRTRTGVINWGKFRTSKGKIAHWRNLRGKFKFPKFSKFKKCGKLYHFSSHGGVLMSLTRVRIYYVSIIVFRLLLSILFLWPTFFRWAVRVQNSVGSHANVRMRNHFAISERGQKVNQSLTRSEREQSSIFPAPLFVCVLISAVFLWADKGRNGNSCRVEKAPFR